MGPVSICMLMLRECSTCTETTTSVCHPSPSQVNAGRTQFMLVGTLVLQRGKSFPPTLVMCVSSYVAVCCCETWLQFCLLHLLDFISFPSSIPPRSPGMRKKEMDNVAISRFPVSNQLHRRRANVKPTGRGEGRGLRDEKRRDAIHCYVYLALMESGDF